MMSQKDNSHQNCSPLASPQEVELGRGAGGEYREEEGREKKKKGGEKSFWEFSAGPIVKTQCSMVA